jgi:hypothetical protein
MEYDLARLVSTGYDNCTEYMMKNFLKDCIYADNKTVWGQFNEFWPIFTRINILPPLVCLYGCAIRVFPFNLLN